MIDENVKKEKGRTKSYIEQYHRMMRFYNRMKEICEKHYEIDNIYNQLIGTESAFIGSNKPAMVYTSEDMLELIQKYIDTNTVIEESVDMIYAFFQNCCHLKDWIKADKSQLEKKVEHLFRKCNKDPDLLCMKICADLCNGSKHCKLTRSIRIDKNTDVNELVRKNHLDIINGKIVFYHVYIVHADNHILDVLELAKSCIERWNLFMKDNSLPIN